MIKVSKTRDIEYLKSIINEPAMNRRLLRDVTSATDSDAAFSDERNLFYRVVDGTSFLGFVSFQFIAHSLYAIHACLKTVGTRTVYAVSRAVGLSREDGVETILAVFPKTKKDINRLVGVFGCQHVDSSFGRKFYNPKISGDVSYYILTNH